MEGPQFSTRAESLIYRGWGASVIGMTNMPEAKLAREAGLCYATLALATDYDCWHETEEAVSIASVLAVMQQNIATARQIVRALGANISEARTCQCAHAPWHAVVSTKEVASADALHVLEFLQREI